MHAGDDWTSPFGYAPAPNLGSGFALHWLQSADVFFIMMLAVFWLNSMHCVGCGYYLGEKVVTRAVCWLLRRPVPPPSAAELASPAGRRQAARETPKAPHPPVTVDGALPDGAAATGLPA